MDRATRICARLIREGAVAREQIPEIDLPDVRENVEKQLADVGLVLATSAYSDDVGVRLSPDITGDPAFDAASNARLRADGCALLVVLWARLVLQKRTATDTRTIPGQAKLFGRDAAEAAREYEPEVREETLLREFGPVLGSLTNLRRLLTQLKRLGFVRIRGGVIHAGPLLELGVDGERMIAFIRRGVLAQLLEEREQPTAPPEPAPADQVLEVLAGLGGSAGIKELEEATGEQRTKLRGLLKDLQEARRVRRTGQRRSTRYHLVEEGGKQGDEKGGKQGEEKDGEGGVKEGGKDGVEERGEGGVEKRGEEG